MMLEKERYCRKKGQRKRFSIIEINKIFKKNEPVGETPFLHLFQLPEAACISWLMTPSYSSPAVQLFQISLSHLHFCGHVFSDSFPASLYPLQGLLWLDRAHVGHLG